MAMTITAQQCYHHQLQDLVGTQGGCGQDVVGGDTSGCSQDVVGGDTSGCGQDVVVGVVRM